jgi:hypothetical protein
MNAPSRIELHVNELVLRGFPAADRFRIAEALQQELQRLFVASGVVPVLGATTSIRPGGAGDADHHSSRSRVNALPAVSVRIGRASNADHVGTAVARAAFRALTGVTAPEIGTPRSGSTPEVGR